jgi:VanZ family protein
LANTKCSRRSRVARFLPASIWAAIIFWTSAQSQVPFVPPLFSGADKIIHLGVYAVLSTLLLWAAQATGFSGALVCAGIAALYGASDEIHQIWVPQRSAEVLDWVADASGALFAAAIWLKLRATKSGFRGARATDPPSR